jgi:hypothetical protein
MFSRLLRRGSSKRATDAEMEPAAYDGAVIRERLNRSMRRRLSDDVESLFHKACLTSDLETGEELLVLLTGMLRRDAERFSRDRRLTEGLIERLTAELRERQQNKQANAAQDTEKEMTHEEAYSTGS